MLFQGGEASRPLRAWLGAALAALGWIAIAIGYALYWEGTRAGAPARFAAIVWGLASPAAAWLGYVAGGYSLAEHGKRWRQSPVRPSGPFAWIVSLVSPVVAFYLAKGVCLNPDSAVFYFIPLWLAFAGVFCGLLGVLSDLLSPAPRDERRNGRRVRTRTRAAGKGQSKKGQSRTKGGEVRDGVFPAASEDRLPLPLGAPLAARTSAN